MGGCLSIGQSVVLSIIVRSFNSMSHNKRIDRVLQSVFSSGQPGVEVIVIDNYSTDSTKEVCARYPVRFIEKRGGRSVALNAGIDAGAGSYVMILDSDMIPDPTIISECLEILSRGSVDCLAIDDVYVPSRPCRCFDAARLHNIEMAAGIGDTSGTNVIVLKKDLIGSYRLPASVTLGEDYLLWRSVSASAKHVAKLSARIRHFHDPSARGVVTRSYFYGRSLKSEIPRLPARFLISLSIIGHRRLQRILRVLSKSRELALTFFLYITLKYASFAFGAFVAKLETSRWRTH